MVAKASLTCDGIAQVQLYTLYIRFVGDGGGVEFEHNRIAQFLGNGYRLFCGGGEMGLHGGDAIGGEDLLAFIFGQDGAPLFAYIFEVVGGALLIGGFGSAGDRAVRAFHRWRADCRCSATYS